MSRRCLVVDDAEDVRLLLGLGLTKAGFEIVAEAATAAAALEAARNTAPDIVLVDLMLPDAVGFVAIQALRTLLPDAQIVACSGMSAADVADACRQAGANHYLEKTRLLDIGTSLAGLLQEPGGLQDPPAEPT